MKAASGILTRVLLSALVAMSLMATARAADEKKADDKKADSAKPANVAGTWKWTFTTQNGDEIHPTLKLKQDGDKITGTITGRDDTETEIKDGKVKGNDISFTVIRKFNDNEITMTYTGKVEGDAIKGKTEFKLGDGEARSRDWDAKREKSDDKDKDKGTKPTASVTGTWKWNIAGQNGGDGVTIILKAKQEGSKVTGTESFNDEPVDIHDGKLTGNEISFKITRKFNDNEINATYKGKVDGDTIKGNVEVKFGDEPQSFPWEAKREKA